MRIRYPDITVPIRVEGPEGNGMVIIGRVRREMRRAGVPNDEIEQFQRQATSGDYDHLCEVCSDWVDMEWY